MAKIVLIARTVDACGYEFEEEVRFEDNHTYLPDQFAEHAKKLGEKLDEALTTRFYHS